MEKEDIINKLIEKGIIKNENDINEDLERFISLRRYYNIDEILQSDLLEKYGAKVLNECIKLKADDKLRNTRFEKGMSIEDMEIYCQIKQANPELDIVKNDRYLHSIDKKYIKKYGPEDLGFIIDKIDIFSYYNDIDENGNRVDKNFYGLHNSNERKSPNIDNAFRYNINEIQLEKLKRIAEQYPDFEFSIFDELFELEQFWDLDDETFKDILTSGRYYYGYGTQQEYLKDIIISGNLDEWLKIKKQNDFLPNNVIFFDKNLTERFNFRGITNSVY